MFTSSRRVRIGDISPDGEVRFDTLARYLQDIARDDSADVAYPKPMDWIVRRTLIEVASFPKFREKLALATWCSGFGNRWAERRTEIHGDQGGLVNAASVWIYVDTTSGVPRRLSERFHQIWGPSAAGRKISARLLLPAKPFPHSKQLPWSIRSTDLDVMNHMNNAAHWSALVEAETHFNNHNAETTEPTDQQHTTHELVRSELEHIASISAHQNPELWAALSLSDYEVSAWLTTDGNTATTARLTRAIGAKTS